MTAGRLLRSEEVVLIKFLLAELYPPKALELALEEASVTDIQDGNMGSIRFLQPDSGTFGMTLVEAQYQDSDGVLVTIAVNADKQGQLFEVDFWKIDFSPLKRYPDPTDVRVEGRPA